MGIRRYNYINSLILLLCGLSIVSIKLLSPFSAGSSQNKTFGAIFENFTHSEVSNDAFIDDDDIINDINTSIENENIALSDNNFY